jgi:predicted Na+-dependent transporter
MDPIAAAEIAAIHPVSPDALVCPYCHQPILPTYYFCPNCGTNLAAGQLSTSPGAQLWLYAFSIILPMLGFLLVTKWQGWKYYKSQDQKTRQIGEIAIALVIISTVGTLWYAYVWTQEAIQSSVAGINADMSATGE